MSDLAPSRAALLELRRDRAVVDLGYRFLDEKRIALAQELMAKLRQHAVLLEQLREAERRAFDALAAAVELHGLEGLQLYPSPSANWSADWRERPFLGLRLFESTTLQGQVISASGLACLPSQAAEHCAEAFAEVCRQAVPLAALQANLRRMADEFHRTQRRVRAIENVTIPEGRAAERRMEALLEEQEQEELARSHRFIG